MRSFVVSLLLMLMLTAISACSADPPPVQAPNYRIASTRDLSLGAVKRFEVRVSLPRYYARDQVEQIAKAVVADLTRRQQVNAISILFYGPTASSAGAYDVAQVDWAPHGRWADAMSVRAGDYSSFQYATTYTPPRPARSTSLQRSASTGLLGVPLPQGARLLKRTAGDPAAARDPSERYSLSASANDIAAFFEREMPAAGWGKDGNSAENALFFRKGKLMIGVLINQDGNRFTLMGS